MSEDVRDVLRTIGGCPFTGAAPLSQRAAFDSATAESVPSFDSVDYTLTNLQLQMVAAVDEWVGTSTADLDEGETQSDRLHSLLLGIAETDGDVTDDDADVVEVVIESTGDYLEELGVDSGDIDLLLSEQDEDAADRVQEFLASKKGAFDSSADEGRAAFDAAYKRVQVIRDGVKKWAKKRISGTVKRSPKQRLALAKIRKKANSPAAIAKRLKSMRRYK